MSHNDDQHVASCERSFVHVGVTCPKMMTNISKICKSLSSSGGNMTQMMTNMLHKMQGLKFPWSKDDQHVKSDVRYLLHVGGSMSRNDDQHLT